MFAEGREHLADVAEKPLIRSHDQHALTIEKLAVVVQQERGAVQPDCGLSCTWSALYDDGALQWSTDHLVLLGLNCGHNVAHGPTSCPFELGQQRIEDPPPPMASDSSEKSSSKTATT